MWAAYFDRRQLNEDTRGKDDIDNDFIPIEVGCHLYFAFPALPHFHSASVRADSITFKQTVQETLARDSLLLVRLD